jgi:hypothetical protein
MKSQAVWRRMETGLRAQQTTGSTDANHLKDALGHDWREKENKANLEMALKMVNFKIVKRGATPSAASVLVVLPSHGETPRKQIAWDPDTTKGKIKALGLDTQFLLKDPGLLALCNFLRTTQRITNKSKIKQILVKLPNLILWKLCLGKRK